MKIKVLLSALAVAFSLALQAEYRIGIIGCDTSHTIAFAKIANVDKDPRVDGFRVTCAYKWGSLDIASSTNRYAAYIPQLKAMGVEMKDSIADLLKDCDGVLLETCDGRPHYQQALEVFKSGKPCFIDKPVAADLTDVVRIVEAGKKFNAKWFCTSALRFLPAIADVRAGKLGKMRSVETWSPIETDPTQSRYYWYVIHGAEPLFAAMGTGCESVRVVGNDREELLTGTWSDGRLGVVHSVDWGHGAGHYGFAFPADDNKPEPISLGKYAGYPPLLASIVEFFKTGVAPVTPEETLEIYAFLSAAEQSRAQGGAAVKIADVIREAKERAIRTRTELLRAKLASDDRNYVFVAMHRGDWRHFPENSRGAIEGCIAAGADIVELDVARTKDGHFILNHDNSLDRTTTGKGKVSEHTLAEIRQLKLRDAEGGKDAPATEWPVLTLEEALEITKGRILMNIDHFSSFPKEVLDVVEKCGATKDVLVKAVYDRGQTERLFGEQYWQKVVSGELLFMPIIRYAWGGHEQAPAMMASWFAIEPRPFSMYELCFDSDLGEQQIPVILSQKGNPRVWVNTLWDSLDNKRPDKLAKTDPDAVWGWFVGKGVTMIQTDCGQEAVAYLKAKGHHDL